MSYTFDTFVAVDPTDTANVAVNSTGQLFDVTDTAMATPLAVTDLNDLPLPGNAVTTNSIGVGQAFRLQVPEAIWFGGGIPVPVNSFKGVLEIAQAAQTAAQSAGSSAASSAAAATTAQTAAAAAQAAAEAGSVAPTDAAVDAGIARAGVLTDADKATAGGLATLDNSTKIPAAQIPDIALAANGARPVGKGELLVNIADYSPVGDGVADDQPAFQNAMNYLMAQGGGTLILERGKKYRVSHSVQCADNTTILGNGATMCKLDATDFQYAIFQTRQGAGVGYGVSLKNFTVRDLNFTADYSIHRSACAFAANHAQNVLFDHCTFIQFQGAGHSFDLCGSDTITITNCVWMGFDNTGPGTTPDAECIQIDNSLNGATSNSESVGSFDALPTINVTISNNKFLPLTIGGVKYPCPNPLGAHSRRENAYHSNIIFRDNLIVDPVADTGSTFRGSIHMIATRGITIDNNTWMVSSTGTPQASRCIGIYAFNTGQYVTDDPNTVTTEVVPISPMTSRAIRITNNKFLGFTNASVDGNQINLIGQAGNLLEDIVIRDNSFRDCAIAGGDAAQYGINIYATYVTNLKVVGNTARTVKQFAAVNNSLNVIFSDNYITGSLTNPIYCNIVTDVAITEITMDACNFGLLMFSITYLTINGVHSKNPVNTTSPQAIGIKDSNSFIVMNCILNRALAASGSSGVAIYGTSDVGYVRNNVITGYSSKAANTGTGTNVTIIDNL